jgi:hypothetical protein
LIPRQFVHFPIDAVTRRSKGAIAFMLAWLDKPLRPKGCGQDGKSAVGGGLSLQSLLHMSCGAARSTRVCEAMPVETIGVL